MISTQLMRFAELNQWKVNAKEEMVFGEYNGYLFTVLEGRHFKAFITPVAGISPDALDQISKYLNSQTKALKLRNYEISDNFLCVRVEEGLAALSMAKMEFVLGQLSGILSLYEVPARSCVVCGEPAQRRGLYLGLFCYLHQECENRDMVDFTQTGQEQASLPDQDAADAADTADKADTATPDDRLTRTEGKET